VKIGLAAIGIGAGARPATLRAIASAADATGFATLWMGQHVVLFDRHDSKYPYSERGEFSVLATTDWLDPFVALSAAATVTSRIRLGTGICLVPQHNPLILAKQVASLDRLSDGRFALGIGVGWMGEEFAALGIPFRAPRRAHPRVRRADATPLERGRHHLPRRVRARRRRSQLPQAAPGRSPSGHPGRRESCG